MTYLLAIINSCGKYGLSFSNVDNRSKDNMGGERHVIHK
jgi:hypothetical protein